MIVGLSEAMDEQQVLIGTQLGCAASRFARHVLGEVKMHWIDPAYLPEIKGVVDRFLIDAHGDADGMLLKDRKEIHFSPQIAKAVVAAFKPGDPVKVRGLRPCGVDMIAAVSMQAGESAPIVDNGPDQKGRRDIENGGPQTCGGCRGVGDSRAAWA